MATATVLEQPKQRVFDLWEHQVPAYHFVSQREESLLWAGMGTGKSAVTVATIENLGLKLSLILCPSKVMGVWRREFETFFRGEVNVIVLDDRRMNSVRKSRRIIEQLEISKARRVPSVVVINYESAWRNTIAPVLLKQQWDIVVCDESQRIKGYSTKTSKNAWKIGAKSQRRLCLTGTPMPNNPGDIFAQFRFLDHRVFGKYWTRFKRNYAVENPSIPGHVIEWINQDHLQSLMDPFTYRISSDVLDLPDVRHIMVPCKLEPKTLKAYRELEAEMITAINEGVIVADNALVHLLRLQQLTGGVAVTEDEPVRISRDKLDTLKELIEDIGEPVVVYSWFRHDLKGVEELAESLGLRYGEISGNRNDLTNHAKMPDDIDVMGVQMRSGGTGIDLTRSRFGFFLSTGFVSHGEYDQVLARQHRPGQEHAVTYYHLYAEETVDEVVYRSRDNKRDIVMSVLEGISEK